MRLRFLVPLALVLGLLCAAASTLIVRPAGDRVITGMGCARTELNPDGLCFSQRPRGGFPLIQISDDASATNRGRLGLEDEINFVAIAGNTAAFAALWLAGLGALSLVRTRRSPPPETAPEPAAEPPAPSPAEPAPEKQDAAGT
jgi:hypothetical protein